MEEQPNSHRKDQLIDALLLALILVFLFTALWRNAHSGWAMQYRAGYVYDNYFIALTAKNISEGKGWGLWNGHEFVDFEREISSGPMVFLPLAVALRFIDDHDTARYLSMILLNLVLLTALLLRLRHFLPDEARRGLWILLPFVLLGFMRVLWHLALGEVSAALLLLLAATYIARHPRPHEVFLAGACGGMALMSKLMASLSLAWLVPAFAVLVFRQHGIVSGTKKLLMFAAGFSLMPAMAALWHLAVFQWNMTAFVDYSADYLAYYFGLYRGSEGAWYEKFCLDFQGCFMSNFHTAADGWRNGQGAAIISVSLTVPLIGAILLFKKEKSPLDILLILLAGICFSQFCYFFLMGAFKWPRYYYIGGLAAQVALLLLLICAWNRWIAQRGLKWALLGAAVMVAAYYARPLYREGQISTYKAQSREVATYINQDARIKEIVWFGIGSQPFPITAYYLDQHKPWLSMRGFVSRYLEIEGGELKPGARLYWKARKDHYLLFEQWRDLGHPEQICPDEPFRNEIYRVVHCSTDELEAFLIYLSNGEVSFPK